LICSAGPLMVSVQWAVLLVLLLLLFDSYEEKLLSLRILSLDQLLYLISLLDLLLSSLEQALRQRLLFLLLLLLLS
jgi:hypothetical protein